MNTLQEKIEPAQQTLVSVTQIPIEEIDEAPQKTVVVVGDTNKIPFPASAAKEGGALPPARQVAKAVVRKLQDIDRIGESCTVYKHRARVYPSEQQRELTRPLREIADAELVKGSCRLGYVIDPEGEMVTTISQFVTLMAELDEYVDARVKEVLIHNDPNNVMEKSIFTFKLPPGYRAVTSEVKKDKIYDKKGQSNLRVEFATDKRLPSRLRTILYTPTVAGYPLAETNILSVVIDSIFGFESWKPGKILDYMHPAEVQDWVFIGLFEK